MSIQAIAIVTGASRGLGQALAQQLLAKGIPLITVARNSDPALTAKAQEQGVALTQLQADLSDPQIAQDISEKVVSLIPDGVSRCLLVNNAGVVQPISNTAELSDAKTITETLTLNVTSVMLMCSAVLRAIQGTAIDCRILNISSGAGRGPVSGWGVYCATKAALDLYTRVLAQEHNNVRAVSLAPGVIDTSMQDSIRRSDARDFPDIERFHALHAQGQLSSPADTARHILHYLDRDDFGTTVLDDIRNYS